MMKKHLCLLILCLPLMIMAQEDSSHSLGIKWATGVSWEQVKQKAKAENKYIFLDAFATWCGPCKAMDKTVYPNDTIGNFFNEKFISVKVQMDKTAKDNDDVKAWYTDAGTIYNDYHITAYPTFVFLSPEGKTLDIQTGYKKVVDFLALGKSAIAPGKLYVNQYSEYEKFVGDYDKGIKKYEQMPQMIKTAMKLGKNEQAIMWLKDYDNNYAFKLPNQQRYTKENIELWSSFTFGSSTTVFQFFYKDGKIIDKVMSTEGYSAKVVDRTIMDEFIQPFFKEQNKNSAVQMTGMFLTDISGKHPLPVDSSEADWYKLGNQIREKFGEPCANRNVLLARIEWYNRHRNTGKASVAYLTYFNTYGSIKAENLYSINDFAWNAFLHSTDEKILKEYISIMSKVIKEKSDVAIWLDTYANLLYKTGKTKKAIYWETIALNNSKGFYESQKDNCEIALSQMKKGTPTYLDEGAVWK